MHNLTGTPTDEGSVYQSERGMALLTVIWILAIFTALIATLSVTATLHTRSSEAISGMGHSTDMAEAGLQSWMAQLRADAIPVENGVILTEIMSEYPEGSPIKLNEVDMDNSKCGNGGERVEIVNISNSSIDVSGWGIKDAADGPGDWACNFSGSLSGKSVTTCTTTGLNDGGDDVILANSAEETIDSYNYSSEPTASYQRIDDGTGSWSDESSCSLGAVNSSIPTYSPKDTYEFIELYNTNTGNNSSDTISVANPPSGDYKLQDEFDSTGSPCGSCVYDLKVHDLDQGGGADGDLSPDQVGLVLHQNNFDTSDLETLGIKDKVTSGEIRLYYLDNGGGAQYFTGGLYNDEQEDITLESPSGGDITVLASDNWDPPKPKPKKSRFKTPKLSTAKNSNDNWPVSGKGGTPGEVPNGDSHLDPWGWGGDIIKSIPMTSKVWMPSMSSTRQKNDYGYFRMVNIEDEAGKIDLLESGRSDNKELIPPDGKSEDRDISSTKADEVRKFADGDPSCYGDEWYTPGTFFTNDCSDNALTASSIKTWERYQHVYSGLRIPQDGTDKKININTAPYTTLKTIKMCPSSCSDEYITHDLALEIIKFRSGAVPSKENGYYKIPNENYDNGGETFISNPGQVCDELSSLNSDFDCSTFRDQVKVGSEGIFRAEVQGVTVTDAGDTKTSTTFEAIVDRRPIENSSGSMKILHKRKK